MGSTLIVALISPDGSGLLMNVGDSRGHMINGSITHTRDQNMAYEMVQSGQLTEEEAMAHPLSKMLNQALGEIEPPVPDFYSIDIKGKYLLLSSDGLHGFVPKERIREIVLTGGSELADTVKLLMDEALQCGSDDNITIILAKEGG
jgi:PPM family protein phosphatase